MTYYIGVIDELHPTWDDVSQDGEEYTDINWGEHEPIPQNILDDMILKNAKASTRLYINQLANNRIELDGMWFTGRLFSNLTLTSIDLAEIFAVLDDAGTINNLDGWCDVEGNRIPMTISELGVFNQAIVDYKNIVRNWMLDEYAAINAMTTEIDVWDHVISDFPSNDYDGSKPE